MYCTPPIASASCDAAYAEFLDGNLAPNTALCAWVLLDAPQRPQTNEHEAEPYRWTCCPFCGGDLPIVIRPILPREAKHK